MKLFDHFNEHAFSSNTFFHPLPTASTYPKTDTFEASFLVSRGGPIKPKVVTSTKDDKRKSKNIDAEKIVLDGGEVRGEGRAGKRGWLVGYGVVGWEMIDNNLMLFGLQVCFF